MSLFGRLLGLDDLPRTRHPRPDPPMRRVLDALAELAPAPLERLDPEAARRRPGLADAARKVLGGPLPRLGVATHDFTLPGAAGPLAARAYRPERPADGEAALPAVLYFHGGGWVIGDLDAYDAAPRAMAALTGALVVSCRYRQGPEHRFPAAHEDAWAAWRWLCAEAPGLGADPSRLALMGEDAGATLACATAIRARDEDAPAPLHLGLVCPVASDDLRSTACLRNARARPVGRATLQWFAAHAFEDPAQMADPRVSLVRADLIGLPPATVVCAEIDPLLDQGEALAECLEQSGVEVRRKTFHGSTHGFFGLAAVLPDAAVAQRFVADDLKRAFGA